MLPLHWMVEQVCVKCYHKSWIVKWWNHLKVQQALEAEHSSCSLEQAQSQISSWYLPRKSVIFQQTQKAGSKGYFSSLAPVLFIAFSLFQPGSTEWKLHRRIKADGFKIFFRLLKYKYPLRAETSQLLQRSRALETAGGVHWVLQCLGDLFLPRLPFPLFSQSHSQLCCSVSSCSGVQFTVQAGQIKLHVCSQIICNFFSNNFLSSAATVCYIGKCNAFIHVILINTSADLGKQICFFPAKANQCMPVFSFRQRSVVCWDLPTVTEQDFGPHSDSVYFWI